MSFRDVPALVTLVRPASYFFFWFPNHSSIARRISSDDASPDFVLIAAAAFFPIGVVHGIGVWFGGW